MITPQDNHQINPSFWEDIARMPVQNQSALIRHWFDLIQNLNLASTHRISQTWTQRNKNIQTHLIIIHNIALPLLVKALM
jgi:hypothetical protein